MERKQIAIRLPDDLMVEMREEADRRGYTVSDLILFILDHYFENTVQE